MNTASQVSYSFVEKYLTITPEGRINRKQFLIRVLIILTTYTLFYFIIKYGYTLLEAKIGRYNNIEGGGYGYMILSVGIQFVYLNFIAFSLFLLVYKPIISLTRKRINDIGNSGKVLFNMIRIVFGYPILLCIVGSIGYFAITYIILMGMMIAYEIVRIVAIILLLILIVRKGKSGNNEYGKDPIHTKVSFLG